MLDNVCALYTPSIQHSLSGQDWYPRATKSCLGAFQDNCEPSSYVTKIRIHFWDKPRLLRISGTRPTAQTHPCPQGRAETPAEWVFCSTLSPSNPACPSQGPARSGKLAAAAAIGALAAAAIGALAPGLGRACVCNSLSEAEWRACRFTRHPP